jgi:hypothetical protein
MKLESQLERFDDFINIQEGFIYIVFLLKTTTLLQHHTNL